MKVFDKRNSKSSKPKSSKPKRQPDPILAVPVKMSGKLGSAQKKRVQKRLATKFNKGKKTKESSNVSKDEDSLESDNVESDNEMDVSESMISNISNSKNPFNFNDDVDDDEDFKMDELVNEINDSDDDEENDNDEDNDDEEEMSIEDLSDEDLNTDKKDDDESIDENVEDNEDITINMKSGDDTIKVTDLDSLNCRIQKYTEILNNYKEYKNNNKENCHPRAYYVDIFLGDLCERFSYNRFLMNKLYQIFNNDLFAFLVASEEDRPMTIRTNTLKTRRRQLADALTNKDCNVENLQFSKVGMVVHSSKVSIGATSEYLAGHYLLQGGSSMLPVMALAPKPGERILDMCAAPGGKTTHIAQIMKNTGCLYVNDVHKDRLKAVVGNLARMGVNNTVVSCHDGRSIHKMIKNCDRVLCDGPCTGTGVISKDKAIKSNKDEGDLKMLTTLQKQLICSAVDACKVGGYVVYSTCSVLVEENEQVIDYVCRKRNVKIAETGLFGTKGFVNFCSKHFNNKMDRTRRYYPHENNMDGFFVAKLQKLGKHVEPKLDKKVSEKKSKKAVKRD